MIDFEIKEIPEGQREATADLIHEFSTLVGTMLERGAGQDKGSGDVMTEVGAAMMYALAQYVANEFQARTTPDQINDAEFRDSIIVNKTKLFNMTLSQQFSALGVLTSIDSRH